MSDFENIKPVEVLEKEEFEKEWGKEWNEKVEEIGEWDTEVGDLLLEAKIPDLIKECKSAEDVVKVVGEKLSELGKKIDKLIAESEGNLNEPYNEEEGSEEELLSRFSKRDRALVYASSLIGSLSLSISVYRLIPKS